MCSDSRTDMRTDPMLHRVYQFIERLRVDDPFLHKQCFQCLHAQRRPRFGGIVSIMVVILVVVVSAHRFLTALFFAFVVPLFFTTRTRPFFVEAADMRFFVGAGSFAGADFCRGVAERCARSASRSSSPKSI